jgi:hypothetical protein
LGFWGFGVLEKVLKIIGGTMFFKIRTFLVSFFLLVLIMGGVSFLSHSIANAAQGDLGSDIGNQLNSAGTSAGIKQPVDPRVTLMYIIRAILRVLAIIVFCLILYAGFLWMTAGGDEKRIEKAQATIKNATIGLAVILASYSITIFAIYIALGRPGTYWDRLIGG